MTNKFQSLLKKLWAKDDGTTIREHTDKLLENLKRLRAYYGREIEELIPKSLPCELKCKFWDILKLACEYHDYGKIHCKFQKKIGNKNVELIKGLPEVKHNLLSPAFVDVEDELIRKIVRLLVLHHHPIKVVSEKDVKDVARVLKEEFGLEKNPISFILKKEEMDYLRDDIARMFKLPEEEVIKYYRLLKGLLLRIDHASSSEQAQDVEEDCLNDTLEFVSKFFKETNKVMNEMQTFVIDNRNRSLVIIAPTGAGKTEAGLIYLQRKGFFTLPYRVSANGVYMRAERLLGDHAGLLHSSALNYMLEKDEKNEDIQNSKEEAIFLNYFLSRNFAKPVIVCTPDQFMHFVFRYKGFEKYYVTALYSKVVIDELQSYDPITLAFIVKALEVIAQNGGKFLVMTATFPEFLRRRFKDMEVEFRKFDLQSKPYHNVQVVNGTIEDYAEKISDLSQETKVLVIVNTVKKAVELWQDIPNAKLLHSRFILKDRKEKEREIKEFFDGQENGMWITTQLAEVSLDLDADYLFTELSTADSLIQRMGRCNRRGRKPVEKPNVFVFTEKCSGIGPVYYEDLHKKTFQNLKDGPWDWKFKWELVKKVYSDSALRNTKYLENFNKAYHYIESLWDGAASFIRTKGEAQGLFRDINTVQVIPMEFKKEVEELVQKWEEAKGNLVEKAKCLNQILEYSLSLPTWSLKDLNKQKIHDRLDVYYVEGDYSRDTGFKLKDSADTEQVENVI